MINKNRGISMQMRRKDKAMDENEIQQMLDKYDVGRLGTCYDNIPYITPVHYILLDGCIYLHCAQEGHKIVNIKQNENVCFEVDGMSSIVQNENPCSMSTNYESVVIFGKAFIINEEEIKLDILKKIVDKYSSDKTISAKLQINHILTTCVIKIEIETITGKKSKQ